MRSAQTSARVYGSGLAWRAAGWLATAGASALLGIVIASWGWRWWSPASSAPPAQSVERWASTIAATPLFGRAAPAPAAVAQTAAPLANDARLLGVLAGRDGSGYALFQRADRTAILVKTGEAIAADVTLAAVRPDGVSIRDHGTLRDVPVRAAARLAPAAAPSSAAASKSASAAASASPSTLAPARGATAAACAAPPGYRGPLYRLNAELLSGVAGRPDSWASLLAPVPGGLGVRDETGFATMLGMKSGDLMAQANGIALTRVEDVLVAFVNPLLASQPVYVVGTRNGQPADWLFVNAGACPG